MVFKNFAALFAARCTVWALETDFREIFDFYSNFNNFYIFFFFFEFFFSATNRVNFDRLDVLDRKSYGLQILCGTICGTMHRLGARDWFSRYCRVFPQF